MQKRKALKALTLASLRAIVANAEADGWVVQGEIFRERNRYCVFVAKEGAQ